MKKSYFKIMLFVFAMSLFANNLSAQGVFVKINAGYGFGLGMQSWKTNTTKNTTSTTMEYTSTTENINLSLGKGLNFGATFGAMFSKNVGGELGLNYLIGAKTTCQSIESQTAILLIPAFTTTDEQSISASMFRINPSIIVASGSKEIEPYAKLGLVIGIGSVTLERISTTTLNSDKTEISEKYNGGIALGVSSALGINFNLNDNMALFGELNMINMSYAPTKSVYTKYSVDGIDQLPTMTIKDKETEYVDSYTHDSTAASTPDSQPDKKLKTKNPFGSLGINLGLKIKF
jgi:hypothetical protein